MPVYIVFLNVFIYFNKSKINHECSMFLLINKFKNCLLYKIYLQYTSNLYVLKGHIKARSSSNCSSVLLLCWKNVLFHQLFGFLFLVEK